MMMVFFFFIGALIIPTCRGFAAKGFGAASQKERQSTTSKILANDEIAEQVTRSLFGICSHLQNPELYSCTWANVCTVDESGTLIATENIARGDIISLYPVHSVGLRGEKMKSKKKKRKGRRQTDYLVYDEEMDGEFFGSKRRTTKYCIDFPAMTDRPELVGQNLFLDANPDRYFVPGWLGHLCARGDRQNANCAAIPIDGITPLCMVVATSDIAVGDKVTRDIATNEGEKLVKQQITECGEIALEKYSNQLVDLAGYLNMAYPIDVENEEDVVNKEGQTYKKINERYPGLQEFHKDPDVYAVDGFLTAEECNRIIDKCSPKMNPSVTKDPETGIVGPDPCRTSTEAMLPRAEAPTIVSKLTSLLDCSEEQLEILQVLRYEKGQEFKAHTDGFQGPVSAAGFENSGRLVTVFTYLNDVKQGGHTVFPELSFSVAPKQGTAIIHFPATLNFEEDTRTIHQGQRAIDEKWLLTTWVWKHERSDEQYSESRLPKLSDEVI